MVSWFLKLHKVNVTERNFRKPVSVVDPPLSSDSVGVFHYCKGWAIN